MKNTGIERDRRTGFMPDPVDWSILDELQRDARQSFSALARKLGLSQPAVADRVRNLESHGIIRGYRVDLDITKLGYSMIAYISVATDGDRCKRLQRDVLTMAEVLECYRVTGTGSLLLRVALRSIEQLEELIDRFLAYGTPTTSLVLSTSVERRNVTHDVS